MTNKTCTTQQKLNRRVANDLKLVSENSQLTTISQSQCEMRTENFDRRKKRTEEREKQQQRKRINFM